MMNKTIRERAVGGSTFALAGIFSFFGALWFFHFVFAGLLNGDSTAHYILAQAVSDGRAAFPNDYFYGNDLIFLRNQYAVALASWLGFTGYEAYSIGSALSVSLCMVALGVAANVWGRLDPTASVVFSALVFLPIGYEEYEFVIGQQSHLLQVALTLISALAASSFLSRQDVPALVLASLAMLLITWDSPPRGILTISAFTVCSAVMLVKQRRGPRTFALVLASMLFAGAGGFVANSLPEATAIGVGSKMALTLADLHARFWTLRDAFLQKYLGLEDLRDAGGLVWLVSGSKALVGAALLCAFVAPAVVFVRHFAQRDIPAWFVLASVGATICCMGVVVVCASQLDVDPRHFLPGILALKSAVILVSLSGPGRKRLAICIFFCGSFLAAIAVSHSMQQRISNGRDAVNNTASALTSAALDISEGMPVSLYGTFWYATRYEMFAPDRVAAAPITFADGRVSSYRWLSRPSRYCGAVDALLIVGPDEPALRSFATARYQEVGSTEELLTIFRVPGDLPCHAN